MTSLAVDELSQLLSEARAKLLELISENDDAQSGEALAIDRAAARVRSLRDDARVQPLRALAYGRFRSCLPLSIGGLRGQAGGRGCDRAIRVEALAAEQKKKSLCEASFEIAYAKNPKLSRQAVHRLLLKKWASLTSDRELPPPGLSSFKKYCKGLKN